MKGRIRQIQREIKMKSDKLIKLNMEIDDLNEELIQLTKSEGESK